MYIRKPVKLKSAWLVFKLPGETSKQPTPSTVGVIGRLDRAQLPESNCLQNHSAGPKRNSSIQAHRTKIPYQLGGAISFVFFTSQLQQKWIKGENGGKGRRCTYLQLVLCLYLRSGEADYHIASFFSCNCDSSFLKWLMCFINISRQFMGVMHSPSCEGKAFWLTLYVLLIRSVHFFPKGTTNFPIFKMLSDTI